MPVVAIVVPITIPPKERSDALSNDRVGFTTVGFSNCLSAIAGGNNWRWRRPLWTDILHKRSHYKYTNSITAESLFKNWL